MHHSRTRLRTTLQLWAVWAVVSAVALWCFWDSVNCDFAYDDVHAIQSTYMPPYSTSISYHCIVSFVPVLLRIDNADFRPEAAWLSLLRHDFWGYPVADDESHKSYRPITSATFKLVAHRYGSARDGACRYFKSGLHNNTIQHTAHPA